MALASAMLDEDNTIKMLVKAAKSAMRNGSNASAVNAAMGNCSIAERCSRKAIPSRYM